MWGDHYTIRYLEITNHHDDVIMGHLYGHLHSDQFRALPGQRAPLLLTGAISTIFSGNPSFRVMVADPATWEIRVSGSRDPCLLMSAVLSIGIVFTAGLYDALHGRHAEPCAADEAGVAAAGQRGDHVRAQRRDGSAL